MRKKDGKIKILIKIKRIDKLEEFITRKILPIKKKYPDMDITVVAEG